MPVPPLSLRASKNSRMFNSSLLRRALLILAGLILVAHASYFDFVNDDAFISFRYADNLVRHGELTYNLGERVEGYTNFLWTITIAGVLALGGDPVFWSHVLGIAFGISTLYVVALFLARWRVGIGEAAAGRSIDALGPLWLAAAPGYACWSTGGLETQQFTFLVTLGLTQFLLEGRAASSGKPVRWPWSGAALGLSALTRPEGMFIFGICGLARCIEFGHAWLVARRRSAREELVWTMGFITIFAPYFMWRLNYYGWPFPNTYYVKTGAESFFQPGLAYVWSFVCDHHLWALPLFLLWARAERRLIALSLLVIGGITTHVILVGGDFMALGRFLVPLMPLLAVILVRGWEAFAPRWVGTPRVVRLGLVVLLGLIFGVRTAQVDGLAMTLGTDDGIVDHIGTLKLLQKQWTAIGKHLAATAPPNASIATTAAGIIPYYSRLYTLDVLGLNEAWIAHNVPHQGNRPGHTRTAPLSYILRKQVDYLVYQPTSPTHPAAPSEETRQALQSEGYIWTSERVPGLDPPLWNYWRRTPIR